MHNCQYTPVLLCPYGHKGVSPTPSSLRQNFHMECILSIVQFYSTITESVNLIFRKIKWEIKHTQGKVYSNT